MKSVLMLTLAAAQFMNATAYAQKAPPKAVAVNEDTAPDIWQKPIAIGVSNSRFANDPSADDIAKFTAALGSSPWIDSQNKITATGEALRNTLQAANQQGLNSNDYWDTAMEAAYQKAQQGNGQEFSTKATAALLRYVNHLYGGRLSAHRVDEVNLKFGLKRYKDIDNLVSIVKSDSDLMRSKIERLAPPRPQYSRLMYNLARLEYAKNNGLWKSIVAPKGGLKDGQHSPVVADIRAQLRALGYHNTGTGDLYDKSFASLLWAYSSSNGLVPGTIDAQFWKSLSTSADERIRQTQLNMEKLRWLPAEDLGQPKPGHPERDHNRFIFVNLAAQELELNDRGTVAMKFRTVNGAIEHQTPSMAQELKEVLLNPLWNSPASITMRTHVPAMQKLVFPDGLPDKNGHLKKGQRYLPTAYIDYLKKDNFWLVDSTDHIWREDPEHIANVLTDFNIDPKLSKYRIVQGPNRMNALGVVKFPLYDIDGDTNGDSIYMHDTEHRDLFKNPIRYFSSGCIRLQDPMRFAAELLKDKYTYNDLERVVPWGDHESLQIDFQNFNSTGTLTKSVYVYVLYMTADQNIDGSIRFFEDAYGLDTKIQQALDKSK